MTWNLKRSVVSVALMMAAGSALAGEVRSTAADPGRESRLVARASIQPGRPAYECDPVDSPEPFAARARQDDGRKRETAAIEEMNHQRFLREVWSASP